MRPTTKDLAQAAGVSLATIDRVLNGRPGVREETVEAVNEPSTQLGFVRNLSAANLARGRTYRFVFLLPRHGDEFLEALVARIEEARVGFAGDSILVRHLPGRSTRTRIRSPGSSPSRRRKPSTASRSWRRSRRRCATRSAGWPERGVRDRAVRLRPVPGRRVDFVGIDNRAAGATAARLLGRFAGGRRGKVLVVAETMNARDSLERRLGFDRVLTRRLSGPRGAPLARDPRRPGTCPPDRAQRRRAATPRSSPPTS